MEKVVNIGRKALAWLLSAMLVVGWGGVSILATTPLPAAAAGVDVGANPAPRVDIAVNVPSDYPGTFAEFKEELASKLIEQGMPASDFRITTTQVAIDTTDTSGWIVYDHYRDQGTYNNLTSRKRSSPIVEPTIATPMARVLSKATSETTATPRATSASNSTAISILTRMTKAKHPWCLQVMARPRLRTT